MKITKTYAKLKEEGQGEDKGRPELKETAENPNKKHRGRKMKAPKEVKQEHGLRNFARSRNSGKTGERHETRRRRGENREEERTVK
jgi:hypothetical protein